jgi:hypothetical protein
MDTWKVDPVRRKISSTWAMFWIHVPQLENRLPMK